MILLKEGGGGKEVGGKEEREKEKKEQNKRELWGKINIYIHNHELVAMDDGSKIE